MGTDVGGLIHLDVFVLGGTEETFLISFILAIGLDGYDIFFEFLLKRISISNE